MVTRYFPTLLPHALKQAHGKRILKVEVLCSDGSRETKEIPLDDQHTAKQMQALFEQDTVVTVHSEEATLEDIFIEIAGRGLS